MCIIVVKPRGEKIPDKKILKNCWTSNDDGAGLCYLDNNKVKIKKGFLKFKHLYKELQSKDFTDTILIIHFRTATSGGISKANCHPFPISKNINDLKALEKTCDVAIAHNGIIDMGDEDEPNHLSDTQIFTKNILADKTIKDNLQKKSILHLIANSVGDSKLVILFGDGKYYLLNGFILDNGIYYSNDNYKEAQNLSTGFWYKNLKYNDDTGYTKELDNELLDIRNKIAEKKEELNYYKYSVLPKRDKKIIETLEKEIEELTEYRDLLLSDRKECESDYNQQSDYLDYNDY